MKHFLTIISFFYLGSFIQAQTVGINSTGAIPTSSAMLDISATDKGLLIPRFSIPNLNSAAPVTSPATSLLVYNINLGTGVGYYFWDSLKWVKLSDSNNNSDEDWYKVGGTSAPTSINDTIFTNGNVGIGVTTPFQKLHISGSYASNSDSYPSSGDVMGGTYLVVQNTFGSSTSPAKVGIRFKTSNFGAGQHTKGGIVYQRSNSNGRGDLLFLNNSTDDTSEITINDTKMIIKNNGSVGIGTLIPTSKLHVVGFLEFSDNAAAIAGGLTIGAFYRTGDILKVVH